MDLRVLVPAAMLVSAFLAWGYLVYGADLLAGWVGYLVALAVVPIALGVGVGLVSSQYASSSVQRPRLLLASICVACALAPVIWTLFVMSGPERGVG